MEGQALRTVTHDAYLPVSLTGGVRRGGGGGVATFNMAGIDLSMYICARMCLDIWLA